MQVPANAISLPFAPSALLLSLDERLEQYYDEQEETFWFRFHPEKKVEGPPHHVHGGFLATLMDEAMGSVAWLNGFTVVTHRLHMEYRRPVPLKKTHTIRSAVVEKQKRRIITESSLYDDSGQVLTGARGEFFIIDFARLGDIPDEYRMFHEFHELRRQGKSVSAAFAAMGSG